MEKRRTYALPPYLCALMERFSAAGEEIYLVGGSLRDLMLGLTPNDYDLATSASPQRTVSLFPDCRVIETGIRHGTVTVLYEGNPVEITTFRLDGSYADARHPDSVTFTRELAEDLSRRDFTVNAMAYHPDTGLVDPFGGREDLRAGILRAVGDPLRRMNEDALRILRGYRFSAQLGFVMEEKTEAACRESKLKLTNIAKERIATEFLRLLLAREPAPALRSMAEDGILPYVTGEYRPGEQILERLGEMPPEEVARLGFYFADGEEEQVRELTDALRLSNRLRTGVSALLRGSRRSVESPADARRLISVCGAYAPYAARASVLLGRSHPEAEAWVRGEESPWSLSSLAVNGRDLQEIGLDGKEIGETLQGLLALVIEDPSQNQRERLLSVARGIKSREHS